MKKKDKIGFYKKYNMKWVLLISMWTLFLAIIISVIAENSVNNLGIILSFLVLIFIIVVGIVFDTIGIAVTQAKEKPFHSMAARKIDEAKLAIKLIRNAPVVSNICNDVIGDISGIISGAVGSVLMYKIVEIYSIIDISILTVFSTALIASLTVGGKAFGKSVAQLYNENIVYQIARLLNFIENTFGFNFFPNKKRLKDNKK